MGNDYRNKEILVIDLGSYSIKALVGKAGSKGIMIRKTFTIPISPNIYTNGDFQNYAELSNVLRDLIEVHGLKNYPVIFTFSSTNSFARVLEVPAVTTTELKSVVEYEMQQYLPADVSAYSTQFRFLSELNSKTDESIKVLAGTIPKIVAENLWNLANECELDAMALDMHPNALVKLMAVVSELNGDRNLKEQNIAFIDMGHTLMDVSIFEKNEFQFNRRILIGGKNIDQRLQRVLGVTTDDARMEKHSSVDINHEVFDYTDESRMFNALKTGVDEWVVEIERVIKFYGSRKAGNKIDRCFLYGGGTGIVGIDQYISKALDIPTEILSDFGGLIANFHGNEEHSHTGYTGETGIKHLDEYLNTGAGDGSVELEEPEEFAADGATGIKHLDAYFNTKASNPNSANRLDAHSQLSEENMPLFINAIGALLRREELKK